MIDHETIARILDAARIEEVVGDFVTLRRRGVNLIGLCPFHDEKTGSFIVSPAKGIYKCFGCGKAGGAVNFIMEHEQMSYPDALRYLAKKYHIEIHEEEMTAEQQQVHDDRESMFAVNIWAQKYFANNLMNDPNGRALGLSYFRSRGFTDETITKFGLGYCLDNSDSTFRDAQKSGYKEKYIEQVGLCSKRDDGTWYDRFRGRVMFPVHTLSGKIVAFGGRILKKNDKMAKYVNSPESEIYHKSNELYGIYFAKQAIIKHDRCFLVEGYTDVISMHQSGVTNVVASSGTSLTQGQIRLIHRFTPNITVLYDGDAAGIKASIRGIDLLLAEGMNVKVVLLPNGEDPDSYAQNHNADEFVSYINDNQVDFIRFKINLLKEEAGNDPIKRAALISDVVNSISLIPDKIIRSVYCKECSTLLEIDEEIVISELQKRLYQHREEELKERARAGGYNYQPQEQMQPKFQPDQPQTASQVDQALIASKTNVLKQNAFDKSERNILHYIVRNGSEILFSEETETGTQFITVDEFIIESLEELINDNGNIFHNPLHQKFEQILFNNTPDMLTPNYFTNNIDPEISQLSADLLSEKYQLSRMHTKQYDYIGDPNNEAEIKEHKAKMERMHKEKLATNLQTVIGEYKAEIIKQKEREIDQAIVAAQGSGDFDKIRDLLKSKQEILAIKKAIASAIGGRVIIN